MDGTTDRPEAAMEISEGPEANAVAVENFGQGVVIGVLIGLNENSEPLVAFPGNPTESGIVARATCALTMTDVGRDVALLFEGGDPLLPLVIGPIHRSESPARDETTEDKTPAEVTLDGERVYLSAKRELVLRCGKASVTLTQAGKILIRGAYLLNRSSGVNRIKGGSVQIN